MSGYTSNAIVIDKFWESIPLAWRQMRNQIRHIALENFKMTEEQFQVLRRIRQGTVSVSALALVSLTSRSAVSKIVDALVRRGLVNRSQDPLDRRNIPLALSSEGQREMEEIFKEAEIWLSARFENLSSEELNTLTKGMEILCNVFSN
jgi:DNA-binding MarR family transcriptional regulator